MAKIYAVHFLDPDMRSAFGDEPPWTVGETRKIDGKLELGKRGYHYSPTWKTAFLSDHIYGPWACIVQVDDSGPKDMYAGGVSSIRTLVEAFNVERELRLYASDEAERALRTYERRFGRKADPRSWAAVWAARKYARGKLKISQLSAAWKAAEEASYEASWEDAAKEAAKEAAYEDDAAVAAWYTAWAAARAIAARGTSLDIGRGPAFNAAWNAAGERFAAMMYKATGWRGL